ncbi:MAG TPA: glycosyltransferase family 4 protein [Phycisphaerae bacterium]|nr:glycosyltransferase family 4 protein [Phycisphaerae bacterium]
MSTGSIRVLHVVWALRPGGLERALCQVIRASHADGVEHAVLCLDASGECAQTLPRGIPVFVAACGGNDRAGARAVRRVARDHEAHIVHAHNWAAWPAAALGRHTTGSRLIWTLQGWDSERPLTYKRRLACMLLSRVTSALTAVSFEAAERFCRETHVPRQRVEVIGNPVDVRQFAGMKPRGCVNGRIVVAGVGRLTQIKDWPVWLEAIRLLRRAVSTDVQCIVAGDGPMRGRLEQLCWRLGLADTVEFVGYQPNVAGVLARADVVMLLSRREGLPMALLEAMAAGVPVVATCVGGVPEVVIDGLTGLLVEPGRPDQAATALARLMGDGHLARCLSEAGRQHVTNRFSLDRVAAQYVRLYRRVVPPGSRPTDRFASRRRARLTAVQAGQWS